MVRRVVAPRGLTGVGACCLIIGGCAAGRMHLVPLHTNAINNTEPLIASLQIVDAYWWEDENGHINIALRAKPEGLYFGTFWTTLTLGEPPAGSAREYRLGREGLSAAYTFGSLTHSRLRSLRGIAAIWPQPDGTLRGRVRTWARRQSFTMLLGWRPAAQILITAEFRARHDPTRGREMRERAQPGAWPSPTRS